MEINYRKIPGYKPWLVSEKYFDREALLVWLHVNNCCQVVVACLYQEGGITGIIFCHQTGGPITGWAYKWGWGGGGLYTGTFSVFLSSCE